MLDTDSRKARVILDRLAAHDAGRAGNQWHNRRLADALAGLVQDWHPGEEIFNDAFIEEARAKLLEQGVYVLPAWVSVTGTREPIWDTVLDEFMTAREVGEALGVSTSTARRWLGVPDTTIGRTSGWRLSTVNARLAR